MTMTPTPKDQHVDDKALEAFEMILAFGNQKTLDGLGEGRSIDFKSGNVWLSKQDEDTIISALSHQCQPVQPSNTPPLNDEISVLIGHLREGNGPNGTIERVIEVLAAISQKPVDAWQPIETIPEESGMFLVCLPRMMNLIVRVRFDRVHKQWLSDRDTDGGVTKVEFFHQGDLWMRMPLPPAPSQHPDKER